MLVFRAGIHKNAVRITNVEDSVQKLSDLELLCLSRAVWQATSFQIKFWFEFTKMLTEYQTVKTLIRLQLEKMSDLGLHCLSGPVWQTTDSQIKCWFEFTKMLSE